MTTTNVIEQILGETLKDELDSIKDKLMVRGEHFKAIGQSLEEIQVPINSTNATRNCTPGCKI